MRFLIVLCAACCVMATDHFEHIGSDIAEFTADLMNFQQRLDNALDMVKHARKQVIEVNNRVTALEGTGCNDRFEFQCGGKVPKCISRLLVCDGKADCANAADESQCHILTPIGSNWKAQVTYDFCSSRKPEFFSIHITDYTIPKELRSFPEVKADMELKQSTEEFDFAAMYKLDGVMDLLPGAHVLYFHPTESNGLALQCTFDGVYDDHCHGEIHYEISQQICAEFHMWRVDDE